MNGKKALVLVVDDEEYAARSVAELMRAAGYEARMVRSCDEALEFVARHPPDLVLSDLNMPCRNGFDLLAKLRADERARHIPVVFVTAMARAQDREACLRAGADGYIEKPVVPDCLLESVREYLDAA